MKLLIILLVLAIEQFAGVADDLRKLDWFSRYVQALENRCSRYSFWNGPLGVIITLSIPVSLAALLVWILLLLFYPLAVVASLGLLLYSLGPGYPNAKIDEYIHALQEGDLERIRKLGAEFSLRDAGDGQSDRNLLEGILVYAHHRQFAVLFWFMVLGPVGAVFYRLAGALLQQFRDIHGGYGDAARNLCNILDWPAARLFTLGNALTGNMVDALEAWREAEQRSFAVNENVVRASGLGALNYQPSGDETEHLLEDRIYWVRALQGMLNRTLLVWLTVLGLMTLSGWLG